MKFSEWLDFKDQVVVITGGRRGIGRALACAFASAGAKIAVAGKSADAGELTGIFAANDWSLFYFQADLAKREERLKFIPEVIRRYGTLDVLINNAGTQNPASVEDYTPEQWDSELALLLTAPFELSQQAGRIMCKKRSGKIINIASISSFQGARNIIGYSTAKHGIVGLTKCLANEFAPHQVNVNAIAPGLVKTDLAAAVFSDPQRAEILRSRIPDGRFADPEDIVGPAMFLAGKMSSHVHGHVLLVDGGWMGR
ncbi:MAG: SDR family oxidoreductase [Lentisphaeria bacterium]|nr:SDR family oxidoreductase [Lentisphaeria bacterium]MBQ9502608.1 SDR family oxidoreductase [Lentisphaeria bacterium]